jgi:hypothetical protein
MPRDKVKQFLWSFRPRDYQGIVLIYGCNQHIPLTWTKIFHRGGGEFAFTCRVHIALLRHEYKVNYIS